MAGTLAAYRFDGIVADAFGLAVPGVLLAWVSRRLPANSRTSRIGAWLLLFSAVAFATQGLFAFDAADPDAFASRMRVMAWTLWWIAFAPGALFLAFARSRGFVALSFAAMLLACAPALLPLPRAGVPWMNVVATLAWFAWWFVAARDATLSRGAT